MTPTALLSELQNQGVILQPRGEKLAFGPKEKVTPEIRDRIVKHKEDLLRLLQPDRTLADLYRRWWSTPETEPMETFTSMSREIGIVERQVGEATVLQAFQVAARRWYEQTGECPKCGKPGVLHPERE